MKYLLGIAISLSSVLAQAETFHLYARNSSSQTIQIEKMDGTQLTIEPGQMIDKVEFQKHTKVKNFIDGKLMCSWFINPKVSQGGINYDPTGENGGCQSFYIQDVPPVLRK